MSDTDPNDKPNDVDRALAAFGATPIKYRSFGKHQLRPSAAYVPAPAMIDDTVYDPFGPQPVVHSLDDTQIGLVLPANVQRAAEPEFEPLAQSEFAEPYPIAVEHPAVREYVPPVSEAHSRPFADPPPPAFTSYEAPPQAPAYQAPAYQAPAYQAPAYQAPAYQAPVYQDLGSRDHDGLSQELPAYHEMPVYGVPESNSDALPGDGHLSTSDTILEPPAPHALEVQPVAPLPPHVPTVHHWTPPAEPASEREREPVAEIVYPATPGERSRMRTAPALPVPGVVAFPQPDPIVARAARPAPPPPAAPPASPGPTAVPPAPVAAYAAPAAPVLEPATVADVTGPATLSTLGSQIAARQNHRAGDGFDGDAEPRSLVEMFRVLNGRPDPGRRVPAPPPADGISLFRRL